MPSLSKLTEAVTLGESGEAVDLAEGLLGAGHSIQKIISEGLTKALEALDVKCSAAEFNLVEILLAARAMTEVMNQVIQPRLVEDKEAATEPAVIILGTIKGDIHDLGKRIVGTVLNAAGLKVVDLGLDVEPEDFVRAAEREGAAYIGVSSLLTITMPEIRKVREYLQLRGLETIRIIAGGAAISRASAESLNVDYVAKDAMDVRHYIGQQMKGGQNHAGT